MSADHGSQVLCISRYDRDLASHIECPLMVSRWQQFSNYELDFSGHASTAAEMFAGEPGLSLPPSEWPLYFVDEEVLGRRIDGKITHISARLASLVRLLCILSRCVYIIEPSRVGQSSPAASFRSYDYSQAATEESDERITQA